MPPTDSVPPMLRSMWSVSTGGLLPTGKVCCSSSNHRTPASTTASPALIAWISDRPDMSITSPHLACDWPWVLWLLPTMLIGPTLMQCLRQNLTALRMSSTEAGTSTASGISLTMWPQSSAAAARSAGAVRSSPSRSGISIASAAASEHDSQAWAEGLKARTGTAAAPLRRKARRVLRNVI